MEHDPKWIEKTHLEEQAPADYYMECCAFLDDFLNRRTKLAGTEVRTMLSDLLKFLVTDPKDRQSADIASLERLVHQFRLGSPRTTDPAEAAVAGLLLFGMVGKALYFLSKQSHSHQFEEEIRRLLQDLNQVRGNCWLFHTAGMLAQSGFNIEFIPESASKTPDYKATRGSIRLFVEANARSQSHHRVEGLQDILWNVMHGDSSAGKQLKFSDSQYDPGLIVVDVSNCDVNANSTDLQPNLKLRADAFVMNNHNGWIYDVSRDPDFFAQRENVGNLIEFSIRYFHDMAATNRYHVRALLVGISLGIRTDASGAIISAPKGSVMFVDSRYPQLALQELSKAIYIVDTQSPLP